ncbi:ATP-binding protein (plasmid) [Deinococcus sp. KNUC1210]|uniref:ATP-binding protein n=1 Tax=Deinococcus sp. KNUC1210 TaxID=2917691 RepID=UPI001EF02592|nr:ATP-binding protein [Deinococcus sp. KNUC1210]ULH13903.1 ATP-binding protein [Deinococcus sp. KNUC1210]
MTELRANSGYEIFVGTGEMSRRMRALDWSGTPLGSPAEWPQSLKTIVRTMLTSRFAMWMAWGEELTFFCNDAYLPTLGVKHTWALGERADVVWSEIWNDIGPRIRWVLQTGEATWDEGLLLFLERSGFREETYHTFSYSPVADDTGHVTGMLCVVAEESERVIGERRVRLLRDLGSRTSGVRTGAEVLQGLQELLASSPPDLPVALTYLTSDARQMPVLTLVSGLETQDDTGPEGNALPPALQAAWERRDSLGPLLLDDLAVFGTPPESLDRFPTQAMAIPLLSQGQEGPSGFLIAGLNPDRPLDDAYRGFLELFAGQLAAALAGAAAYEQQRTRAEALAEIDRAKTTFFSNVSHEFRTPLTLMLGPLEELLAHPDALDPAQLREVEVAHRNALRLLRLVNTMLDFTRIEAGRADAVYLPTDVAVLTADLASSFRSLMEEAGLRYDTDLSPLSEALYLDQGMWEKIVLNLLSNAFKFTFEGRIHLKLEETATHAVLSLSDTGTGIPAAELPRVFERFHRVEGARGRSFEGTGIGLALVKELVALHGGEISVSSTVGVGTTFQVQLPKGTAHLPPGRVMHDGTVQARPGSPLLLAEASQWHVAPLERQAAPVPHRDADPDHRPRLLVADDNADLLGYVTRLLADDYHVEAVSDGVAALRSALADPPDLVLSDVMMPALDGFGLLQALRADELTRQIPVILLSARAGEEARLSGMEAGADDYLTKPFSSRELRSRVAAHLELSRFRTEISQMERERNEELERRVIERTAALEERSAALDAFVRFTEAVGVTADSLTLAQEALDVLKASFGDASVAYYQEQDGLWKALRSSDDITSALLEVITAGLSPELPVFAEVLRTQLPVFVDSWATADDRTEHTQEYGTTSLYPLVVGQNIHAMLSVALRTAVVWSERDKAIVRAVGRGLNLALERAAVAAQLEAQNTELEARTRSLEGFAALTRDLSLESDPVLLVRRAQELVLPLLPGGYAAYYEPDGATWRLRSQYGNRGDDDFQRLVEAGLPFESTQSLFLPWSSREAYYVDEYDQTTDGFGAYQTRRGALAGLPVMVNGQPYGIFGVALLTQRFWGITERTVLQTVARSLGLAIERALSVAQLAQRTRDLERSNAELEQFAYVASHDLQEPLRTVTSFSQLLTQRYASQLDDKAQIYARHITQGTERMAQLIQDLLAYSRVASEPAPMRTVSLGGVVSQAIEDLRTPIEAAQARIVVEDLPQVHGDAAQLRQVFQHLLANAVKFRSAERPPLIQIRARQHGDHVQIDVQDNGIGIEEEYFDKIFVIFQRLHPRGQYEGSGIGLSIARKIVERHGGLLWPTRNSDHGMTFSFTLPTGMGA